MVSMPIWKIFGELILEHKIEYGEHSADFDTFIPDTGEPSIWIFFDGYGTDEEDEDILDMETYSIVVEINDEKINLYGCLIDCLSEPKIDESYMEEWYDINIDDLLSECSITKEAFEKTVREIVTKG